MQIRQFSERRQTSPLHMPSMFLTTQEERQKMLKIIKLQAENFKGLKAIEITPNENSEMVVISGANGQGKTSVLDAIWHTIAGGKANKNNIKIIRDGEDHATVQLTLDGEQRMLITRKWKNSESGKITTKLTVTNEQGMTYQQPQNILDSLVGALSFDPTSFGRLDAKKQLESLLQLCAVDYDFDDAKQKHQQLFDERTIVNRNAKSLVAQLSGLPTNPVGNHKSLPELMEQLHKSEQSESARNYAINRLQELEAEIYNLSESIKSATKELEENKSFVESTETQTNKIESLRNEISNVENHNKQVDGYEKYVELTDEIKTLKDKSTNLTALMEQINQEKINVIKNIKMPITGLTFDDDGLLFNDVPLQQCSAAEQLKVNVAMAMALNPTIRVIRITDGSLLDKNSIKIIEEMAKENDYQIWLEMVDTTGQTGIIIENGEIK